ncbi:hypothetical protein AM587_10004019 [Phytophthora nicotianae]|uniref:Uncharacterized protein n=1 Tax=Phytophthora nicotianae TaxID=4792 RepID=A0A0W8DMV3_PHYNI|nr:hypothetical protein AM587_10004019 [Phytophthora nicotianae]
MQHLKVRRALRIDHSVKFCKKLKNWTGSGQREGIADGKMLLLAQNEIGQIIGRRLTRSENNEETEELLRSVAHSFQPATSNGDLFVVSDDASSVRNMVHRVFQDRVSTKQDPFHVIQRITTKVKVAKRKWIAKELKAAIYTVDREMRPTQEMESAFRHVVERLSLDDVSCSVSEWRGCYESNLGQIRRGDLFVQESVYKEGGKAVRVVSTSQLEGFDSALKNHGAVAESPQLEFALNMISQPQVLPQYRSVSRIDFALDQWIRVFEGARIINHGVDSAMTVSRPNLKSIKEMFVNCAKSVRFPRLHNRAFFSSLQLRETSYEPSSDFSLEEYELLRQVKYEQARDGAAWGVCPLVTTILFNIAVDSNTNASFRLHRRSYSTIVRKLKRMEDSEDTNAYRSGKADSKRVSLFCFESGRQITTTDNTSEQKLMIDLFEALRSTKLIKNRVLVFVRVYDFASRVCDGIFPKAEESLRRKWAAIKNAKNNGREPKIKPQRPTSNPVSSQVLPVNELEKKSANSSFVSLLSSYSSCSLLSESENGAGNAETVESSPPTSIVTSNTTALSDDATRRDKNPGNSTLSSQISQHQLGLASTEPICSDTSREIQLSPVFTLAELLKSSSSGTKAAPTTSQNVTICESTTEKPSMSDTPRASQIPTRIHTEITPEIWLQPCHEHQTKWTEMIQLFREKYPDSDINANSLRCRLKVKKGPVSKACSC